MPQPRILIIENEGVIALDLDQRLTQLGYAVIGIFASGEQALYYAAQLAPDLVLMNIRLQGTLDGIQTALALREFWDAPIIYLTASTDAETIRRAEQTQPGGYLVKPVDDLELRATLQCALAVRRQANKARGL